MSEVKQAAGVLLIHEGQVLLVRAKEGSRQLTGTLAFPGGQLDEGEKEIEAAFRELKEETGLEAKDLIDFPGNLIQSVAPHKTGEVEYTFKVYLAKGFQGELVPSDETEPFWTTIEEARQMKLLGKNNEVLDSALKFLNLL